MSTAISTELTTIESMCPRFNQVLRRTTHLFDLIRTWEDLENFVLRGDGLSAGSYKTYMVAVRQFWEFTEGLHPFQIRPAHIEAFYDHVSRKVAKSTAYSKVAGLRKFFAMIEAEAPIAGNPFREMSPKLRRKLSRSKKTKTRKALTEAEFKGTIEYLREAAPYSGQHAQDLAVIMMLATSGLRAAELCSIRWKDLEDVGGRWVASFTGKGGDLQEQELYADAVELTLEAYRAAWGRKPNLDDALFYTIPMSKRWGSRPFTTHKLWEVTKRIGADLKTSGIIKRNLVFSPHLFRRTYATLLYRSGMKLKALMRKTRHANIEVLANHYIDDDEPAAPYFRRLFGDN